MSYNLVKWQNSVWICDGFVKYTIIIRLLVQLNEQIIGSKYKLI